jgi:hypothetical protein
VETSWRDRLRYRIGSFSRGSLKAPPALSLGTALIAAAAIVVACVSPTATPTVLPSAAPPRPTPTRLAFEGQQDSSSGSFYKPPGWDGISDVNCKDFDTHAHAQSFFIGTNGSTTNDPYGLDGDHDAKACETLP